MNAASGTSLPLDVVSAAALGVPGVTGLHPRLSHRLAAAAASTGPDVTAHRTPPEAGVRADRTPDGSHWHIEVRCILAEDHGVLDTARTVHDRVRAAVLSYLAATPGAAGATAVTVTVTVTRIEAEARIA